ncbi:hypothetical protein BDV97DRAFT_357778 [Delphinella strobiligena]|nr:hypothetical protein BDV97DRAFT_357778 [Delphinella strobiligena]
MAPPTRQHGLFGDAPQAPRRPASRPASRTANHLQETYSSSGHALRSAAVPTGGSRSLFVPSIPRGPTAASSNTQAGEVLEDSDDGEDRMRRNPSTAARSNRIRRARAGTETTVEPDEDDQQSSGDFVIRDKGGNYLREVPMIGEADADIEEEQQAEDVRLTAIARDFWTSGAGLSSGRGSRRLDEEDSKSKDDIMIHLREAVDKKLADEIWMYEPTDYLEELRIKNHGI